jgi:hypothetical protein
MVRRRRETIGALNERDFPHFPYRTAADHSKGVAALFSAGDLRKVDHENALRLLPRLRT